MATTEIRAKVDTDIKKEAEETLDKIGISLSDLINMTLRRVVYERRIPFDTQVPEDDMPDDISVDSVAELQALLDERLANDDGRRCSPEEVRVALGLQRREQAIV